MRFRNKLVQIVSSDVIFRKNDDMMRCHFADRIHIPLSKPVDALKICNMILLQHLYKFYKNLRCRPCIIYRTVMVFQGNPQCLRHQVQLIF